MKTYLLKRLGLAFLVFISVSFSNPNETHDIARINGTFLQLNNQHASWKQEDWGKLMSKLMVLGVEEIIVQWTVYDSVDFSLKNSVIEGKSVLDNVLQICEDYGINVYVGLIADPGYWRNIEQSVDAQQEYLNEHFKKTVNLAKRLRQDLAKTDVFQGWYISEEIDDINWQNSDSSAVLFKYLNNLSQALKKLTPDKDILISGFSNAKQNPKDFEQFWSLLLFGADIDRVLFQDGVGVHKLSLEQLPIYLSAVQGAADLHSVEFQAITEIFTQIGGVPLDNGPFKAQPAAQSRIRQQLKIAGAFTPTVIAFSVPEYMSSLQGLQTERTTSANEK